MTNIQEFKTQFLLNKLKKNLPLENFELFKYINIGYQYQTTGQDKFNIEYYHNTFNCNLVLSQSEDSVSKFDLSITRRFSI